MSYRDLAPLLGNQPHRFAQDVGATNDVTAVTIVAAPGANTKLYVTHLRIVNTDSLSADPFITLVDSAGTDRVIWRSDTALAVNGTALPLGDEWIRLQGVTQSLTINLAGATTTNQLDWLVQYVTIEV